MSSEEVSMEMEIAGIDATVGSEKNASAEHLLQVARALRGMLDDMIAGTGEALGIRETLQFAAQHIVFSDNFSLCSENSVATHRRKVKKVPMEGLTICTHSCSEHVALMNPTVWRGLPEELLKIIFSRLPLPQINRLRCLSKGWNRNMNSEHSDFKRVCAIAYPKLFALISENIDEFGRFWVRVFDIQRHIWHAFEITCDDDSDDEPYDTMSACDGGLVCFVATSKQKKSPLLIFVCNPLTQAWRLLPLPQLRVSTVQLKMVQLVMNDDRKGYKVLVVSHLRSGVVADFFDSKTNEWIRANSFSDLVYGWQYRWERSRHFEIALEGTRIGPAAYDCVGGQLLDLNSDPLQGENVKSYALVKDRAFVLLEEEHESTVDPGFLIPEYCITEYQGQRGAPYWIKVRDHNCDGLGFPPLNAHYYLRLHACRGFLLVVAYNDEGFTFKHQLVRLYDMSTGEWHTLPKLPADEEIHDDLMCELQWDASP